MAVMLTNVSTWLWGRRDQESTTVSSSINSTLDAREVDTVKFSSRKGIKLRSALSRRPKRKWHSREERRVDKEYDLVLVPSDGGCCLSGSESDDSDWSIGWMEPHAPDFQSGDEIDSSFAVLVPCYGHGCQEVGDGTKNRISGAIGDFQSSDDGTASAENGGFLEQYLSSLQNS